MEQELNKYKHRYAPLKDGNSTTCSYCRDGVEDDPQAARNDPPVQNCHVPPRVAPYETLSGEMNPASQEMKTSQGR